MAGDNARSPMSASNVHAQCDEFSLSASEAGRLRELLPMGISVAATCKQMTSELLLSEERAAIASCVPKRAAEFATGRWCARQAMARLGIRGFPLLPNADRAPVWPPNIVGSITHTEGYCAAAVGRRDRFVGIGIDAEMRDRVALEVWSLLFTAAEIDWLEQLPTHLRATMATVLFSAKESFYKAQYSLTGAWLEFRAVTIIVSGDSWNLRLESSQGILAKLRLPISGRFVLCDRIVVTAIAIEKIQIASS
ncbi:MAG: 4'-phosphopantetheinyl transferase superfamily protein [Pseudomonadota bacterium]